MYRAAWVLVVVLGACARETPPEVAVAPLPVGSSSPTASAPPVIAPRPASSAPPSPPPPAPVDAAECTQSMPPADMVKDNVAATNVTGLGEIVASSKVALDGTSPAPTTGYVTFRYEVRVLRWFSGTGPERLVLSQGAEAPSTPYAKGRLMFFSGCASNPPGAVGEPDVGYFFSIDPACRANAETLGETAARRANVGAKHRARACERGK